MKVVSITEKQIDKDEQTYQWGAEDGYQNGLIDGRIEGLKEALELMKCIESECSDIAMVNYATEIFYEALEKLINKQESNK